MKLHQLSLFLENKPGQLKVPCRILADAGINILTLTLADTQQFGILRLIVRDWKRAQEVLQQNACLVKVTEVVAVEVPDRPGGLADIADVLDQGKIGIEYMYAFTFSPARGRGSKAALIFRFDDPDAAIAYLQSTGYNVLQSVELYERVDA